MAEFQSFDSVRIAFETHGEGKPVLLLHGFASDSKRNWQRTGLVEALTTAGYRTIAPDARGHGASDKPHDEASYGGAVLRRDVRGLMDHVGIDQCFVLGYSMGARTAIGLLSEEPKIRAAVLGGVGGNIFRGRSNRHEIADALVAEDPSGFAPTPRAFRSFADATGADKEALSAAMRAGLDEVAPEDLEKIITPALVITGDADTLAGSPKDLADALGSGRSVVVTGDHLNAIFDPLFSKSTIEFLDEQEMSGA
jgi:pimeloyl-ACP methyl ester carboxylesterase